VSASENTAHSADPAAGSKAELPKGAEEIAAFVARLREELGEDGVVPVEFTRHDTGEVMKYQWPVAKLEPLLLSADRFRAKKEAGNVGA
jgi:hypothetical protein